MADLRANDECLGIVSKGGIAAGADFTQPSSPEDLAEIFEERLLDRYEPWGREALVNYGDDS